jgi:hypothetical protein
VKDLNNTAAPSSRSPPSHSVVVVLVLASPRRAGGWRATDDPEEIARSPSKGVLVAATATVSLPSSLRWAARRRAGRRRSQNSHSIISPEASTRPTQIQVTAQTPNAGHTLVLNRSQMLGLENRERGAGVVTRVVALVETTTMMSTVVVAPFSMVTVVVTGGGPIGIAVVVTAIIIIIIIIMMTIAPTSSSSSSS